QPSNQATKQPSNQATKQPSNQFLLAKSCIFLLIMLCSFFAKSQTGVINYFTPNVNGHHYAFLNSKAIIWEAQIGEVWTADANYTGLPYLKVSFSGDNFNDYFSIKIIVESPQNPWAFYNPIMDEINIPDQTIPARGIPYASKAGNYAKIRIRASRKPTAPDDAFSCKLITVHLECFKKYGNTVLSISPARAIDLWVSNYSPILNKVDFEDNTKQNLASSIWNTPDLFIKDNDNDNGIEPFDPIKWNNDFRNISGQELSVSQKPSIWNRYALDYQQNHLEPMHSIQNPPTANYMWAAIENRSCLATPQEASLKMFWTIARVWEPWTSDWNNYFSAPNSSSNNFVIFPTGSLDPDDKRPAGNEITITNRFNYASVSDPITVPVLSASMPAIITGKRWIVPNPVWYENQSKFSFFFNANKTKPAICLLAVLEEPWKNDNGLYFAPAPFDYNVNIIDFVSKNNNVATRNTFALNSIGGYLTRSLLNQNPVTKSGMLLIDNPHDHPSFGLVFRNACETDSCNNFLENGQINIHLDMLIWQRWMAAGAHGQNVSIVSEQIISITNNNFATLDSIKIFPGERSYIALEAEFYENSKPITNYQYNFGISAYTQHPDSIGGVATTFQTFVLADPNIEQKTSIPIITKQQVQLFPNPSNGNFTLSSDKENIKKVIIYDIAGKIVEEIEFALPAAKQEVSATLKLNGIYFIDVVLSKQIWRSKLVFVY
ncbi:MAG: T9SS type A sorting domain-containing protein, partial [bacterium]|nr:T9SS type A sorting domain-containing protein [bacterium]